MRIVGYGNRQRGDDAAGLIAAERLRAQGFDVISVAGDALDLVESWQGATELVIIDAVVTGAPAGTIHVWKGTEPLPALTAPSSTHGMGLLQALELARTLNRLPAQVEIWGIEGKTFDVDGKMTPAVKSAIEEMTQRIAANIVSLAPAAR